MIRTKTLELYPGAGFAVLNITHLINEFIVSTGVNSGQLVAFYKHTTGSVIIGEHEPGIIADIENTLEIMAPERGEYIHHLSGIDYNGWAHVRAGIMPTSVIIPIDEGMMTLGTHQEILVVDNQPEALPRYVVLQVIGD